MSVAHPFLTKVATPSSRILDRSSSKMAKCRSTSNRQRIYFTVNGTDDHCNNLASADTLAVLWRFLTGSRSGQVTKGRVN